MNPPVKKRSILFSGPMILAIRYGLKTQTRRAVKWKRPAWHEFAKPSTTILSKERNGQPLLKFADYLGRYAEIPLTCTYGQPGDRLRVKEHAWMWCEKRPNGTTPTGKPKFHYVPMREAQIFYCVDHPKKPDLDVVSPITGNPWGWRKKLGRFLPSWASRMDLEISNVRVERLRDITEEDAKAEGIERDAAEFKNYNSKDTAFKWLGGVGAAKLSYSTLWDSINGHVKPGKPDVSWQANPWVWVLEFKPLTPSVQ